jgi:hypothetical protein
MTLSTLLQRGSGNGDEFLWIWLALPCALMEGPRLSIGVMSLQRVGEAETRDYGGVDGSG